MSLKSRPETPKHAENDEADVRGQSDSRERDVWLAQVVESCGDGIIGATLDGVIVSWNRSAARIFGYTEEEAVGRPLSLVLPSVHGSDLVHLIEHVAMDRRSSPGETLCLRKDGREVSVLISISPIRSPEGRIAGVSAIARETLGAAGEAAELRRSNEELARIVRSLEQRAREMNLVQQLSTLLQTCLTAEEAHPVLEQSLAKLFPAGSGALFERNSSVNLLEASIKWGESRLAEAVFEPEECWALRRGQVHRVADPSTPLLCPHLSRVAPASSICAPLVASGETLGVLSVQGSPYELTQPKETQERILAARQQLTETVAGHIALALANLKLRDSLRAQSIRDAVTGLFNRRYLDETLPREIHRASRDQRNLGIIMCDLDSFKAFNDTYGHAAGDSLLKAFGDLVGKVVRAGDIACRYGGDEFVLILMDASLETAKRRAELLEREFRRIVIQQGDMFLNPGSMSLGVSAYPAHGGAAAALLRVADEALYRAKAAGGNRVVPGQDPE
ncbi:MAG TPA: diguanylate cyclase [Candidatus Acidoferrales bacterium]|nr:diguanylate cyclase [Candidatus Acidoferrales bacterium]